MLSLNEKEVKESLKNNEQKFTLKMNTCMMLLNNIKYVVKVARTWKNTYKLHQPSDFIVHVNGKDDDGDEEEDVEIKYDEIDNVNMDDEEEEQEVARGSLPEIQSIEETDVKKIVVEVMASFPHSLRKTLVQSASKKAPTELVVTTIATPSTHPNSGPIQLGIPLTKVVSTSFTKQQVPLSSRFIMQQQGISTISSISTIVTSPFVSTIVYIPHIASTMTIENKSQLSTKVSNKVRVKKKILIQMRIQLFQIGISLPLILIK